MRLLVTISILLLSSARAAVIAQTAPHPPATVVLDASDFVTVLKWAFAFLGLLLLVIAGLGVSFFGFDVRSARTSIEREMSELRKVIEEANAIREELRKTSQHQREAQNDLEEIGAKVEEVADQSSAASITGTEVRSLPDLIREVLRSSRFEWTTIGRVVKRTGLSRDQILDIVRGMRDVRIGTGKRSQDLIFRFKREGEL